MYNTIIFDVDGTLIDTEIAVLGSLQQMLRADYGREASAEELSFVLGIPGSSSLPQLGIHDIDLGMTRWNEEMKHFYHTMQVFEGITEVMHALKQGELRQGIVTSKTGQELQDDFLPFGLMKYLNHAICADDTERHKPNPDPLLKFLEISGADPATSIYIGDTVYDYECARDAGVDFGLALWGCKNHEGIPAKYKFSHPRDILRLTALSIQS